MKVFFQRLGFFAAGILVMCIFSQWRDYREVLVLREKWFKLSQEMSYGMYRMSILKADISYKNRAFVPGDCVVLNLPEAFQVSPDLEKYYKIEARDKDGFVLSHVGSSYLKEKGIRFGSGVGKMDCAVASKIVDEHRRYLTHSNESTELIYAARTIEARLWVKPPMQEYFFP